LGVLHGLACVGNGNAELHIAHAQLIRKPSLRKVRTHGINGCVGHVGKGLIHPRIESADAQVLIVGKAEESPPSASDVPIELADILRLAKRSAERPAKSSSEGSGWDNRILQGLRGSLGVQKVEQLILNKPTSEVPAVLIAPKLRRGLTRNRRGNFGR